MNDFKQHHPFDLATKLTEKSGKYYGQTAEEYANMVGPFGGIIAATILHAVIQQPNVLGEPLSLTINYAAPIADGEFRMKVKEAKTSRTTQHWIIEILQNKNIVVTATSVFAIRRDTWSATEGEFPSVPPMNQVDYTKSDQLPAWVNNYHIRYVQGEVPGTSQRKTEKNTDSVTMQWIQDKPKRPIDFLSLTSMCDAFFPRVFVRRQQIVPASTVSLTIYFHVDAKELQIHGDKEVLGHARAHRFNNGFFDQTAEMWTPEGQLLATTSQIVYYKD